MSVRAEFEVFGAPFRVFIRPPDEDERAAIIDPPRWILSLWEQVRKRKRRDPKIYEYLWQGFSSIAPRLAMRVRVDRAPVPEGVFASSVAGRGFLRPGRVSRKQRGMSRRYLDGPALNGTGAGKRLNHQRVER